MSNTALHHKPRTSRLRLITEREVATCEVRVVQRVGVIGPVVAVEATRWVEEPVPCTNGARCAFCAGSGKHTVVREVTATIPSPPPPSTQHEDGLCPSCGQWIGCHAKDHCLGEDACGWKAQS